MTRTCGSVVLFFYHLDYVTTKGPQSPQKSSKDHQSPQTLIKGSSMSPMGHQRVTGVLNMSSNGPQKVHNVLKVIKNDVNVDKMLTTM